MAPARRPTGGIWLPSGPPQPGPAPLTRGGVPGAADVATFNISTVNTAQKVNLNANQLALGLSFLSTGTTTLQGGGTNRSLTLGTSGIVKTGTGAATVGSATANQNVAIALAGDQLWSNTVAGALTVVNGIAPSAAANRLLTLGGTGGAASTVSGIIANNGAGVVSLTKSGTTQWTLSGANTFTGAVSLNDGVLQLNANTGAGTNTITLNPGGTTGTATRLLLNGAVTIANPVTLAAGSITGLVGQGALQQTGAGQGRINGAITINGTTSAGGQLVGGTAAGMNSCSAASLLPACPLPSGMGASPTSAAARVSAVLQSRMPPSWEPITAFPPMPRSISAVLSMPPWR